MDFINLKKLLFEKHNSKNKSTLTTCEKAFTMYAICNDKHADYKKKGCIAVLAHLKFTRKVFVFVRLKIRKHLGPTFPVQCVYLENS